MNQDIYGSPSWNVSNNNLRNKVLIVDNNIDTRNYIERLLRNDFDVCYACDGRMVATIDAGETGETLW
ncbi:834_t:CDS:2 [Scutellospora calospora]|uniref:834_t:CDS:1 n=1 Tax=Scutellospora calospora TaxID=85575 RepID=A0ACA9KA46_9GLOM|nr:834_t:CDS:2 [Scutellospora calospora]